MRPRFDTPAKLRHGRSAPILLIALWLALVTGKLVAAQEVDSPENLTDSLVALHAQYDRASPARKAAILARLQTIAAARNEALAARVGADPGAVLKVALPPALWRGLPASVRQQIEEAVELDGNLEVLQEDRIKGGRLHYKLKSFGQEYALHFKKDPPNHLRTGARVRIRGIRVNNAVALQSGSSHVQTLASVSPNTFGNQTTLMILVNFRNNASRPYDVNYANQLVFTTANNFFLENSYQQTHLSGVVKGWYTIDMDSPRTGCDYQQIANKAEAAAQAAGVVLSSYRRRIYAFPYASGCGWWGLGTVGGNPSRAWVNGSLELRVVAHELGHNFGLWHSHSLDCGTAVVGGNCSVGEYGDSVDTMGSSSYHFNAFQKERLGWLGYGTSPPILTAEASSSYTLSPYETLGAGPKALKVLKSTNSFTGRSAYYYAECRRPIGFDSGLAANANVLNGFVVHTGDEASGDSSYLLDMSPSTASWDDPALALGYSFRDRTSGVTLTPEIPCGDAADGSIAVSFGVNACVHANPDVTLSPSTNQWVTPSGSANYTLTVRNRDDAACGPATFNLVTAVPADWNVALADSSVTIAAGGSAATSLALTAPALGANGYNAFSVTASHAVDDLYTDTADAGVILISALQVSATTNKVSYRRSQTVTITTSVTALGAPVSGAAVSLMITRPNGAIVYTAATTKANGSATVKIQLGKKPAIGTWQVQATATAHSVTGADDHTFTVF
jgi:hypothetical protein